MSFWDKNREILQKRYSGLYEKISLEMISSEKKTDETENDHVLAPEDIKIDTTPASYPTIIIKGLFVHSQRDPVREAQRLVETAIGNNTGGATSGDNSGNGAIIVLGFGLGYTAQALAQTVTKGRPVIIVEKYKNLLTKAFELRDLSDFLIRENVIFVVGGTGDGILDALAAVSKVVSPQFAGGISTEGKSESLVQPTVQPTIIKNRTLCDIDADWYKAVENKIRTWAMKDEVNAATLKRFGRRWVRNIMRNMSAVRDYPGISLLSGLAADCNAPVFLAAAGPSLDKIAPLLRDIHSRCIIAAVDTSLRFFVNNGIQPDFVLVVDPQFWNSRHLDRCVNDKTILIAESAVYPPVLNQRFRKTFLCGSLFPLGTYIEMQVDPKGRLGAGGSVATTAWDFARSLVSVENKTADNTSNEQNIWIAGLDLAFPALKTHFRGARFEERANSLSCRFNPIETWVVRALRDGIPYKARSSTGGEVLTDRRLSLYAAWFENQFSNHKETQNLSLFHEGLAIKGLQAGKPEELLALPERRCEIDKRLTELLAQIDTGFFSTEETQKRTERYDNAVSSLKRGLKQIKEAAEEGADISRRTLKRLSYAASADTLNPSQQSKILKQLDEITQRITNSEVKEVAGFLFPPVEDSPPPANADPFRAYLESSLRVFMSLGEAAGDLKDFN